MFGQNRDALRRNYLDSWAKYQRGEPLQSLEQMIVDVIVKHPEYQPLLNDPDSALSREWHADSGESNPFLHMGMHIAIQEQLTTGRPAGIVDAYQALVGRCGDHHVAEHRMMECLGAALWQAQRAGVAPDEQAYLECLQRSS